MEKRNFTRVNFSVWASIKYEDHVVFGDVDNVSLQGLFFKTEQEIPLNTDVGVTVYNSSCSSIYLNAKVIRHEHSGIGMQIHKIDANSFVSLRNIVALHCNDQDLVMRETYKMAGCIH